MISQKIISHIQQYYLFTKMKDLDLPFQGSPQKFGKAAYCDLFYTQSKLYDNIFFKNLLHFKDMWNFKSQALMLEGLLAHFQEVRSYRDQESQCIIQTQREEIKFLRQQNHLLIQKNYERTQNLLIDHKQKTQRLIKQRQEQLKVMQAQKQILENQLSQLQDQVKKNTTLINGIEDERERMQKTQTDLNQQNQKLRTEIAKIQKEINQVIKQHREEIAQLSEQKLESEIRSKRLLLEKDQQHKQLIQQLQRINQQKLQFLEEQKLSQSLLSKEALNNTITSYESLLKEKKLKISQLQEQFRSLTLELEAKSQRNLELQSDIRKQDELLDQYEDYLKKADLKIGELKETLMVLQEEVQSSRYIIQKSGIQKQSLMNRIRFCEDEAKMWRESYYLNKSRAELPSK